MNGEHLSPTQNGHIRKQLHKRMVNYYNDIQKRRSDRIKRGKSTTEKLNDIYTPDRSKSRLKKRYIEDEHRTKKHKLLADCMKIESKKINLKKGIENDLETILKKAIPSTTDHTTDTDGDAKIVQLTRSPVPEEYASKFEESYLNTAVQLHDDNQSVSESMEDGDLYHINTQNRYQYDDPLVEKDEYTDYDFHQRKSKEIRRLQYSANNGTYGYRSKSPKSRGENAVQIQQMNLEEEGDIEIEFSTSQESMLENNDELDCFYLKENGSVPYRAEFRTVEGREPFFEGQTVKLWPMEPSHKVFWGEVVPTTQGERDFWGADFVVQNEKGLRAPISFTKKGDVLEPFQDEEGDQADFKIDDLVGGAPIDIPDDGFEGDAPEKDLNNGSLDFEEVRKQRDISPANCLIFDELNRYLGEGNYSLVDAEGAPLEFYRGIFTSSRDEPEWCVLGQKKDQKFEEVQLRREPIYSTGPVYSQEKVVSQGFLSLGDDKTKIKYLKLSPEGIQDSKSIDHKYIFLVSNLPLKRPETLVQDEKITALCDNGKDYNGNFGEEDSTSFRNVITKKGDFVIVEPFEDDPKYMLMALKKVHDALKDRDIYPDEDLEPTTQDKRVQIDLFCMPIVDHIDLLNQYFKQAPRIVIPLKQRKLYPERQLPSRFKPSLTSSSSNCVPSLKKEKPNLEEKVDQERLPCTIVEAPLIKIEALSPNRCMVESKIPLKADCLKGEPKIQGLEPVIGKERKILNRTPKKEKDDLLEDPDSPEQFEDMVNISKVRQREGEISSKIKQNLLPIYQTQSTIAKQISLVRGNLNDMRNHPRSKTPKKIKPQVSEEIQNPDISQKKTLLRKGKKPKNMNKTSILCTPEKLENQVLPSQYDSRPFNPSHMNRVRSSTPTRNLKKIKPKNLEEMDPSEKVIQENRISGSRRDTSDHRNTFSKIKLEPSPATILESSRRMERFDQDSLRRFRSPSRPNKKNKASKENQDGFGEAQKNESPEIQKSAISPHRNRLEKIGTPIKSQISKIDKKLRNLNKQANRRHQTPQKIQKKNKPKNILDFEEKPDTQDQDRHPERVRDINDSPNQKKYDESIGILEGLENAPSPISKGLISRSNFRNKSPNRNMQKKKPMMNESVESPVYEEQGLNMPTRTERSMSPTIKRAPCALVLDSEKRSTRMVGGLGKVSRKMETSRSPIKSLMQAVEEREQPLESEGRENKHSVSRRSSPSRSPLPISEVRVSKHREVDSKLKNFGGLTRKMKSKPSTRKRRQPPTEQVERPVEGQKPYQRPGDVAKEVESLPSKILGSLTPLERSPVGPQDKNLRIFPSRSYRSGASPSKSPSRNKPKHREVEEPRKSVEEPYTRPENVRKDQESPSSKRQVEPQPLRSSSARTTDQRIRVLSKIQRKRSSQRRSPSKNKPKDLEDEPQPAKIREEFMPGIKRTTLDKRIKNIQILEAQTPQKSNKNSEVLQIANTSQGSRNRSPVQKDPSKQKHRNSNNSNENPAAPDIMLIFRKKGIIIEREVGHAQEQQQQQQVFRKHKIQKSPHNKMNYSPIINELQHRSPVKRVEERPARKVEVRKYRKKISMRKSRPRPKIVEKRDHENDPIQQQAVKERSHSPSYYRSLNLSVFTSKQTIEMRAVGGDSPQRRQKIPQIQTTSQAIFSPSPSPSPERTRKSSSNSTSRKGRNVNRNIRYSPRDTKELRGNLRTPNSLLRKKEENSMSQEGEEVRSWAPPIPPTPRHKTPQKIHRGSRKSSRSRGRQEVQDFDPLLQTTSSGSNNLIRLRRIEKNVSLLHHTSSPTYLTLFSNNKRLLEQFKDSGGLTSLIK